jgi:hypothetical protein
MKLTTKVRPTPSLVVASLALAVATGGTSYAAMMIGSAEIKDDSVRSVDVRDDTIRSKDVRDRTLRRKDFRAGALPRGPRGPQGEQGPAGVGRWALVGADGQIIAQSGGFSVAAAYPTLDPAGGDPNRANGNVYLDAGEDLTDNGVAATVALQNTVDQNGDTVTNGRAGGPDANPEFSGEIAVAMCQPGIVNCAPPGTGNTNHLVVSPRLSDGSVTTDGNRKRFYVVVTGGSPRLQ